MEGRASTFKKVLADFESRLHGQGAEFVAIDTELTGVDIEGEPDTFNESANMRMDKNCRIAERYTLIQLGLTVVGRAPGADEGRMWCASYNLFAFPYVGPEIGREPGFFCQASALRFNAQHNVDFNAWIGEGVPYMSREDEKHYLETAGAKEDAGVLEEKVGLLLLWKALCQARLPFVVHCPLDLFFLLAAFERRKLPRGDPQALAAMIRRCTPKVYDTAHLHGALGCFKRLSLMKYFEDVKARYGEISSNGSGRPQLEFELRGETAARYGKQNDDLAHEAGFDSLITAQLFAYLRVIWPTRVREEANRLFLYRSVQYLDLDKAAAEGQAGVNMFDPTRVTLLVAELDQMDGSDAPRSISSSGAHYKWMDSTHILVVMRASGGAAVRKAGELSRQVRGVKSWMNFEEWLAEQPQASSPSKTNGSADGHCCQASCRAEAECKASLAGNGEAKEALLGAVPKAVAPVPGPSSGPCARRRCWGLCLLAMGVGALLLLLLAKGRWLRRWSPS